MAVFHPAILTNAGKNLLALVLQGHQLLFTKGQAGSSYIAEQADIEAATSLKAPRRDMQIEHVSLTGNTGTALITLNINNAQLTEGFFLREIGLFAKHPLTQEELLFSYTYSGETADFLPAQDSPSPVWYRFQIQTVIDSAQDVKAIITDNPLGVSYVELIQAVDDAYKFIRERERFLQEQINVLSEAVIRGTISRYELLKQRSDDK